MPSRAERLISATLLPADRPAILGDLAEEFAALCVQRGEPFARQWYWRQTMSSLGPNLARRWRRDPRRRRLCYVGAAKAAFGAFLAVAPNPVCAYWFASGLFEIRRGAFARRPAAVDSVPQLAVAWTAAILCGAAVRLNGTASSLDLVVWFVMLLGLLPFSRRIGWRRVNSPKYRVRRRRRGWFDWTRRFFVMVPGTPLGLSDVVLCRAASSDTHIFDMLFDASFASGTAFRVYAVVNGATAATRVSVALVGRGRIAKEIVAAPGFDLLAHAPVLSPFDDMEEEPLDARLGEIDVRMELSGVRPGAYHVQVTVTDGDLTATRSRSIAVVAPEPSPSFA